MRSVSNEIRGAGMHHGPVTALLALWRKRRLLVGCLLESQCMILLALHDLRLERLLDTLESPHLLGDFFPHPIRAGHVTKQGRDEDGMQFVLVSRLKLDVPGNLQAAVAFIAQRDSKAFFEVGGIAVIVICTFKREAESWEGCIHEKLRCLKSTLFLGAPIPAVMRPHFSVRWLG